MRISELAAATGVSVATIKYYLREGLLPPGRKVGERLSDYDETHARRLRLLRVLREVGGVPVERLRALVDAVEDESRSAHEMFGLASDALATGAEPKGEYADRARTTADNLIARAGWIRVRPDAPDRESLAAVLAVLFEHGFASGPGLATPYLEAADSLARFEVSVVDQGHGRGPTLERMVLGEVVVGQMLLTLRRLALEHYSAERFGQ